MIERKPLLECYKSSVFKSVDQAWQQIMAFDLQKKMVVIRSVGKKVHCNIDAKCYVQSFNSSKRSSMWNIIASCLFLAEGFAC